jgi:hypothetical protein
MLRVLGPWYNTAGGRVSSGPQNYVVPHRRRATLRDMVDCGYVRPRDPPASRGSAMRFAWLLPTSASVLLLAVVASSPDGSQYGAHRDRYTCLLAMTGILSVVGCFLRWGPLVFGTIVGSVVGMAAPMTPSDSGLSAAIPFVFGGFFLGFVADCFRNRSHNGEHLRRA